MESASSDKEIRVLVSGASVAGLSTAHWLARYGFKVTVVERAPHLRPGGQALDVRGPALEVAEQMGILGDLRKRATKLRGAATVDADGKEIHRTTDRSYTGGSFDSPDIEVLRDDLCKVLYDAVGAGAEFLFDDKITSITQDENGADVTFSKGEPRRFDLVIGADGLYSGVRRQVFGPDERFMRFTGQNIAVFSAQNFLGLDHWQVMHMDEGRGGLVLATDKDAKARVYLGFFSTEPVDYDFRDIEAQKRLIAEHFDGAEWEFPRLLAEMQTSPDFYFYQTNQVHMGSWSQGRVVLVGDAGYSVSPASGQGTTVAMVGAYVLAGELAASKPALLAGVSAYENELRDYVARNLDVALKMSDAASKEPEPGEAGEVDSDPMPDGIPNFGEIVQQITLKNYPGLLQKPIAPRALQKEPRP